MTFSKLVVAKHSPKNGCNAPDAAVLIVEPRKTIPQKTVVPHAFLAVSDKNLKSKYGWVKETSPFTLDQFVASNLGKLAMTPEAREHLRVMFESVQNLAEGTAVAATYRSRGVIERRMEFTVHKVVFYSKKSP